MDGSGPVVHTQMMRFCSVLTLALLCSCSAVDELAGPSQSAAQMRGLQQENERRRAENDEERRRKYAEEAERDRRLDERRAEEARIQAEVTANAKRRGFAGVDFKRGLVGVIAAIARGEISVENAAFVVVCLNDNDDEWRAFQALGPNDVLFRSPRTEQIVWLRNYKKDGGGMTWLEGAKLRAMEQGYVIIKGTKSYGTVIGTRQAIVIEADF